MPQRAGYRYVACKPPLSLRAGWGSLFMPENSGFNRGIMHRNLKPRRVQLAGASHSLGIKPQRARNPLKRLTHQLHIHMLIALRRKNRRMAQNPNHHKRINPKH